MVDSSFMEFPNTLHVDFYNDSIKIESTLDAMYAKYLESQKKIFLKDSVMVINLQTGDTLKSQELWWEVRLHPTFLLLVVLVLLVLQLVSSGGTFPWQTIPQPLHLVHQALPMGYVVNGMRHLVYGADLSMIPSTVAGLFGYTLLGMALSMLAVRKHKFWTLKTLKPEIAV